MSNRYNNVLYVGVTNDLVRRVAEHKAKINKGFTYKYNADKLVYFEQYHLMTDAIAREKQLKNWKRDWKNQLIDSENKEWKDLSEGIGITDELIESAKTHCYCHSEPDSKILNNEGIGFAELHFAPVAGQARNDEQQDNVESEFEKYRLKQDQLYQSDFDRFVQLEDRAKELKKQKIEIQ